MTAAEACWNAYAEEARRLSRLLSDPLASQHQLEAQRTATQRSFRAFYAAFCGNADRPRLRLVA